MLAIQNFQQRLFSRYTQSLTLPPAYNYLHGSPVQPVVPLNTAQDGVMIIGAYPSARFAIIGAERDVPVADICGPFSTECYFDGSRVRTIASGAELEQAYLAPLGLQRSQCWMANLVRLFLFKEEHVAKYRRLGCDWPAHETRSQFETLARQGIAWLEEEIRLARPKLIITLGAEVAGILQGINGRAARNALLSGNLNDLWLDDAEVYPIIHLAHPGIVMRPASKRNPWPRRHWEKHLPMARGIVRRLVG